jgi:hypothetical protein
MQRIPGWIVGALGTAAVVAAFYMGGRAVAAPAAPEAAGVPTAAAAPASQGLEFTCEPGQRVVVREATTDTPHSISCVGGSATGASQLAAAPASVMALADAPVARPYVQRTVVTEPLEVYQPRSVPVSYPSRRPVHQPVRSKTKSAVIIGSSTAVGATVGGLTKGKKGAVIGGLIGGGAAAVWDQVTRRQGNDR